MNWFSSILKILGPRVLGAAAAIATTKLAEQGVTVDPGTLVGIGLGTYAAVHKAVSAHVNPGDSATGRVAEAVKTAANDPQASNTVIIPPKTP